MRLNLLPPERYPHKTILAGNVRAARASFCAPSLRPLVVIVATLVWLVRWTFFLSVCLFVGLLALPFLPIIVLVWLVLWCRALYCGEAEPLFTWCVVVECAPEEASALWATVIGQINAEDRRSLPSWTGGNGYYELEPPKIEQERGLNPPPSLWDFVILGRQHEEKTWQPGPLFYGGQVTMLWLAQHFQEARIPCFVARRTRHACKHARHVKPETLFDDWAKLVC